jgi:outer membrane protein OmpA-like peptidoglycan-associated protein
MKKNPVKTALLTAALLIVAPAFIRAQVTDPKQVATQDASNHANNDVDNSINNGLNKTENSIKGLFKKKNKGQKADSTATKSKGASGSAATSGSTQPATTGPVTLTAYANYDFVPGEQVVFEDHFTDDQDGEFPAHWHLTKGQGIINKIGSDPAFFLTEGNYVRVGPRMKTEKDYLPENFTVEFDFFPTEGSYLPMLLFTTDKDESRNIQFGKEVATSYFRQDFNANYPGDKSDENYFGRWHHAAMIKKGNQIKCYEDQYRVLVIPECEDCKMSFVEVGGIGSTEHPIVFRNFRLAEGGNMNLIGQKFTDAKIITHGINFDVDKATIKPESMGTLNMIVNVLKTNPDLKFEIDGHTDNTGTPAHNLNLSQQRADAVKTQLIAMGIDAARLTTKGFGDTKPLSDNSTQEGKANNRRVEFVKM